jgi:hypothetical protein
VTKKSGFETGGTLVAKVKIEDALFDRAKRAAQTAGYSSVEEFIADCIEKQIQRLKVEQDETEVTDQLRGLGYVE